MILRNHRKPRVGDLFFDAEGRARVVLAVHDESERHTTIDFTMGERSKLNITLRHLEELLRWGHWRRG